MELELFGLLYIAERENSSANIRSRSFQDGIEIYLKNAINLNATLQKNDISFTLLTNQKDKLDQLAKRVEGGANLATKEICFETVVPSGINFYPAHFKFDTIKFLSTLNTPYVGMVDLDVLALNRPPECLINIINDRIPLFYDISDQVIPEYGHPLILRDMKKLSSKVSEGKWAGGEFLTGTPEFFALVYKEVQAIYGNYLNVYKEVHHQGDELPMSVALEILRHNGVYIADAGSLGIIGRYWSIHTRHPQKPLAYFRDSFLLHLPADKVYMAKLNNSEVLNKEKFLRKYTLFQGIRHILSGGKRILKTTFHL